MVGDNAELTFVRCPSCRSLVPAISTKCRMCGSTFDASQEVDEKPRAQTGRVRQQTTSVNSNGEESGESAQRSDRTTVPQNVPAHFDQQSNAQSSTPAVESRRPQMPDIDDPLRGYVEEVSVDQSADYQDSHKSGNGMVAAKPIPSQRNESQRTDSPRSQDGRGAATRGGQPQASVLVESGKGRPGGLSFGKQEQKMDPRRNARSESAPESNKQPARQPQQPQRDVIGSRENENSARTDSISPPKEPVKEQQRVRPEVSAPAARAQQNAPLQGKSHTKVKSSEGSTLVGWLVDFANSKGEGIELREGQFFITKVKLKESDLVLENDSISTPHALVRVTVQSGLEVQDLMSEKGVQLQRREGDSFKPQEERARLNHGDRVRFGDLEYLVVLVPQKGTKS